MVNLSRLQLFARTIETFLMRLKKAYLEKVEALSEEIHNRYLEREGEGNEEKVEVTLKDKVSSTSLQDPSDPDATYGHKGKGYQVQISETCNSCKELLRCLVSRHKKHNKLSFTKKELVIAMRRVEQETHEFKEEYKIRSGIEATNSELKRKYVMGKVWTRDKVD